MCFTPLNRVSYQEQTRHVLHRLCGATLAPRNAHRRIRCIVQTYCMAEESLQMCNIYNAIFLFFFFKGTWEKKHGNWNGRFGSPVIIHHESLREMGILFLRVQFSVIDRLACRDYVRNFGRRVHQTVARYLQNTETRGPSVPVVRNTTGVWGCEATALIVKFTKCLVLN